MVCAIGQSKTNNVIKENIYFGNKISNEQIRMTVVEGTEAVYQYHHNQKRIAVRNAIYTKNSYITGFPDQHIIGFADIIMKKLSEFGKQLPLEQRSFYWELANSAVTQKIHEFIDEFSNEKNGLGYLRSTIDEYISKTCEMNAIFG